jgi:curved DNA-binding protein CbpA
VSEPDHYLALGVAPDATTEEVHDAWRFAVQAFHPDRFTDPVLREKADRMARRVNAAWQVLGDADRRARYDRARLEHVPAARGPERELPCPACGTLSTIADQHGAATSVRCPACAQEFTAIVGAQLAGRPELEMRFLAGRYRLDLADGAGRLSRVRVRRLPSELALAEGETLSLVFRPDGRTVRYIVVHGARTDIGWKVR